MYSKLYLYIFTGALFLCATSFAHADVVIDASVDTDTPQHTGRYRSTVFTSATVGYTFYVDAGNVCAYSKTTDGGNTWGSAVSIKTSCVSFDIWFDQWTPGDTTGTKIYVATTDSSDLYYSELDTSNDSLSTALNISSTNQGGGFSNGDNFPTITKATDGEVFAAIVDNGDQFMLQCSGSCTANISNWSEAGTGSTDLALLNAAGDAVLIMPLASGNILLIGNDISADDFVSKVWNDTTPAWDGAWTNIDTSAVDSTSYNPSMAATVNKSNNDIYFIYGADIAAANTGDVRASTYSGGSWTAKTAVGTNFAVPTGALVHGVSAAYDETAGAVYAAYTKSTSTPDQLGGTDYNIFYKMSVDGMTTWGPERGPLGRIVASRQPVVGLALSMMGPFKIYATWDEDQGSDLYGAVLEDRLTFNQDVRLTFAGSVKFKTSLAIVGALAKGGGTFVIDHPLAPFAKLLYHSFVESPEPKNVYDGVAKLDQNGEVRIQLPAYFEALNTDFRYQFFPHFAAMPNLYVKEEVRNNSFVIAGGKPGGEISWQITGNRHDPYILANPIIPEVLKGPDQPVNRGECLFEPLCR